ncbi:MAG: hypothetical protein WB217_10745 [Mesobacillus sp.]|uniref:hypothetical protein n=1 Tax=Mesobacillus sp. TaxID=2675271 RepID=UPI003C3B8458
METGALHSLFNHNPSQQVKTASLRPGQIINGKIIKLFPEQIAEIQIGNQKMIAQLETPLSANERYWFQVQPGEGKVRLKVIATGGEEGKQSESFSRILGEFSLPANKENLELVRFFLKEQLPVSREILQQASEWLKSASPRSSGLEAIHMILTRGLPVTEATFSALYTVNKEPSLTLLMENLLQAIDQESNTETMSKIKLLLNEQVPSNGTLAASHVLGQIAATWLKGNDTEGQAAFKLLQQAAGFPAQESEKMVLQQMLSNLKNKNDRILKEEIPAELNFAKKVIALLEKGEITVAKQLIDSIIKKEPAGTIMKNGQLTELVEQLRQLFAVSPVKEADQQEGLQAFKKLIAMVLAGNDDSESGVKWLSILHPGKESFSNAGAELLKAAGNAEMSGLTSQQIELLRKAINNAEQGMAISNEESAILTTEKIKSFLSSLGLSYERELAEAFKGSLEDKAPPAESLKPHLIRLLNENTPHTVKDAAEQLLNKITGFQLLSQETGPIQQLIVQMPFIIGGKMSEVTVQWSGQKTEDGKINADYCRVLFYLKLEHLDDTIVDMQVQNRIMSMQVINQHPSLKTVADQLLPLLKNKLTEVNYHLSAVSFSVPGASKPNGEHKKLVDLYSKKDYSRVDIKI